MKKHFEPKVFVEAPDEDIEIPYDTEDVSDAEDDEKVAVRATTDLDDIIEATLAHALGSLEDEDAAFISLGVLSRHLGSAVAQLVMHSNSPESARETVMAGLALGVDRATDSFALSKTGVFARDTVRTITDRFIFDVGTALKTAVATTHTTKLGN